MINIKIHKKDLWLISAIVVFLVGVGYVVAYHSGASPSVMGHSAEELEGVCKSDGTGCPAGVGSGGEVSIKDCEIVTAQYAANCPEGKVLVAMDRSDCTHITGQSGGNCWAKCCRISGTGTIVKDVSCIDDHCGPFGCMCSVGCDEDDEMLIDWNCEGGYATIPYPWNGMCENSSTDATFIRGTGTCVKT